MANQSRRSRGNGLPFIGNPRRFLWVFIFVFGLILASICYQELVAETLIFFPSSPQLHDQALTFGASDARVYSWIGTYYLLSTQDRDLQKALLYFKKAAELSPLGYQQWNELGVTYEMLGDYDNAVAAYKNRVTLSPNSFEAHWSLANCLLRKGDYGESIAEFRRYLDINTNSADYVFDLLNRANGNNLDKMTRDLSPLTGPARSKLALFAIGKGRSELAAGIWREMSAKEKEENRSQALRIIAQMLSVHDFQNAKMVWSEYAPKDQNQNAVVNGSFELELQEYPAGFGWELSPRENAVIGISDEAAHGGKRSLLLNLSAAKSRSTNKIEQLLAPIDSGRYRLSYFAKGSDFPASSSPVVVILTEDGKMIASDQPGDGNFDWVYREIFFDVPDKQKAVKLSIVVPEVATSQTAIAGKLWLDDLSIQRQ